jgi:very-short-patch-repair endonuclease
MMVIGVITAGRDQNEQRQSYRGDNFSFRYWAILDSDVMERCEGRSTYGSGERGMVRSLPDRNNLVSIFDSGDIFSLSWRENLNVNPSKMESELAFLLEQNSVRFQTQVDIPVTVADFLIPREGKRPLLVFVDGNPHFAAKQSDKDEQVRSVLRMNGWEILELKYVYYSNKQRDSFLDEILLALGRTE